MRAFDVVIPCPCSSESSKVKYKPKAGHQEGEVDLDWHNPLIMEEGSGLKLASGRMKLILIRYKF